MILIQSIANDNSTDDILDWIYYLSSETVMRVNDIKQINSVYYNINDNDEILNLTVGEDAFKGSEISKFWYRRGKFSFDEMINGSVNCKINQGAKLTLTNELNHLLLNINNHLKEKHSGINQADDNFTNKITNLRLASKVGLKIPDTLIASEKPMLIEFIKKNSVVISKPINSSAFVVGLSSEESLFVSAKNKLLTSMDDINERLFIDAFLPSLFQEYIHKEFELRIFYFMESCYAMAIFSQANEKTRIDFRNYDYERPNRCVPFILPDDIAYKLIQFMKAANLNCGSIDMIYNVNGDYIFLEVNPIGQFQWLDRNCNYYLDNLIAQYLTTNT